MSVMSDIFHRLFQSDSPVQPADSRSRAQPRRRVRLPVRALVGVELKHGHVLDLSTRGARIRLNGMKKAPKWVDLEFSNGIQRGLVRWSRMREDDQWEGGVEFEHAGL
ncbi:hypothetical protein ABS71_07730 [bacterium SCN 62-11]|nr:MAG: hypothetical protein ABS71_07730 [bacterium SCN 62-11]